MARPLRIELAGGLHHATSRGDRREDIFLCDGDRHVWLEIFGDVSKVQLGFRGHNDILHIIHRLSRASIAGPCYLRSP
jgi:hypothetical protein